MSDEQLTDEEIIEEATDRLAELFVLMIDAQATKKIKKQGKRIEE